MEKVTLNMDLEKIIEFEIQSAKGKRTSTYNCSPAWMTAAKSCSSIEVCRPSRVVGPVKNQASPTWEI